MRLDYQITLREFVAGRNYAARLSPSLRVRMAQGGPGLAILVSFPALDLFAGHRHSLLVLWCGAAAFGVYLAGLFYQRQRAKNDYREAQVACDNAWLEADDDGLRLPDGVLPWGEMRKCADLHDMFLLFRDDAHAVVVPKRGLGAEQVVRFRILLQTMAGRYAVPLHTSA